MNTTAGDSGAPTQGEREELEKLFNRAFVFGRVTEGSYNEADAKFKAWMRDRWNDSPVLAALSPPQEEAGVDEWPIVIEAVADARADYDEDSEGWAALDAFVAHYRRLTEGDYRTDSEHGRWLAPQAAPPNAIRPARVWADGTVREWWVDDGDGPKIVVVHQELAPPVAQPGTLRQIPDGWLARSREVYKGRPSEWTRWRVFERKPENVTRLGGDLVVEFESEPVFRATPPVAGSRETADWPRLRAVFERIWPTLENYMEGRIGDIEVTATLERLLRAPGTGTEEVENG